MLPNVGKFSATNWWVGVRFCNAIAIVCWHPKWNLSEIWESCFGRKIYWLKVCVVYRKPGAIYSNKERRPKSRGKYRCKKNTQQLSSVWIQQFSLMSCLLYSLLSCAWVAFPLLLKLRFGSQLMQNCCWEEEFLHSSDLVCVPKPKKKRRFTLYIAQTWWEFLLLV